MTAVECRVCSADTDAYLCAKCTEEVAVALGDLPALMADLDITVTRQDRGTDTPPYAMRRQRLQLPGLHYDEGQTTLPATPWPLSWDAASLAWAVRNTALTWARHLSESRGLDFTLARVTVHQPLGPVCAPHMHERPSDGCDYGRGECQHYHPQHVHWPARSGCPDDCTRLHCRHKSCAAIRNPEATDTWNVLAWLLRHLDAIRYDQAAAEIHDELTSTVKAIMQAIDRQDPDIFAGPCDSPDVRVIDRGGVLTPIVSTCGADLYARLGDTEVKCGACGCEYDIKARKKWLVEQIPDALAVTTAIANALTTLLENVTPSMIRQMAFRSEITSRGVAADGKTPLYRVGDVIEILQRRALRKADRAGSKRRVAC